MVKKIAIVLPVIVAAIILIIGAVLATNAERIVSGLIKKKKRRELKSNDQAKAFVKAFTTLRITVIVFWVLIVVALIAVIALFATGGGEEAALASRVRKTAERVAKGKHGGKSALIILVILNLVVASIGFYAYYNFRKFVNEDLDDALEKGGYLNDIITSKKTADDIKADFKKADNQLLIASILMLGAAVGPIIGFIVAKVAQERARRIVVNANQKEAIQMQNLRELAEQKKEAMMRRAMPLPQVVPTPLPQVTPMPLPQVIPTPGGVPQAFSQYRPFAEQGQRVVQQLGRGQQFLQRARQFGQTFVQRAGQLFR